MIKGLDGVERLIKKLDLRKSLIQGWNGTYVEERKVILNPFLHQGDAEMSEKESAQFEIDNKEMFDQLRKNKQDIEKKLE